MESQERRNNHTMRPCLYLHKDLKSIEKIFSPLLPASTALLCSSSQFSSVTQSCLTLWNPMDCSTPGFPLHHRLPELAQTHVQKTLMVCYFHCVVLKPSVNQLQFSLLSLLNEFVKDFVTFENQFLVFSGNYPLNKCSCLIGHTASRKENYVKKSQI